jgi:hypothetical protein
MERQDGSGLHWQNRKSDEENSHVSNSLILLAVLLAGEDQSNRPISPAKALPAPSKVLPSANPVVIDADQAVRIAERFVLDHQYTTDFIPLESNKPQTEPTTDEEVLRLAFRDNPLRPRARGYTKLKLKTGGWVIGFEWSNPHEEPNAGVGVFMDKYGNNIGIVHMGIDISKLEPRPK